MKKIRKEKQADGSIWYIKTKEDGTESIYKVSPDMLTRSGGEVAVDKAFSYEPSPHAHPTEYAHLYDEKAHEEN